jgi:DNA-binding MarR family transcriptional regulator
MSYSLVTDEEFCWVLQSVEPTLTAALATHLPTSDKGVYMRLRRFDGSYVTHTAVDEKTYRWSLTEAGRTLVANAELPPIESVDLDEYFAGRTTSINPNAILHEVAIQDGEWVSSSVLYDALPYAKSTIRKRLRQFYDDGLVDRDESQLANQWRLTERGRTRLAEAEDHAPRSDDQRIFEERL